MRVTVTRTYRFRAQHSLPQEYGVPWSYPHEHDYTVDIEAEGGTPTDELDRWWEPWSLDGAMLNAIEAFGHTTVEDIACALLEHAPAEVLAVSVCEDQARSGTAER
jgi:hypothetical protein